MNLSKTDLDFLETKGIEVSQVEKQIENFKKGFPFVNLDAAAIIGNGILRLPEIELDQLALAFDSIAPKLKLTKFVPASGAASRMFKDVFDFIDTPSLDHKIVPTLEKAGEFAFSNQIENNVIDQGNKLDYLLDIAKFIVLDGGLNYGSLPTGVISFHKYGNDSRTAFEEHLVEGGIYSNGIGNISNLHFTVSPEHEEAIKNLIDTKRAIYEAGLQVNFHITYSQQATSTDTIAVDLNNEPFREEDGSLLFRPGGHGALIENLNQIDSDIIFVKNIDNVVPDHLKEITIQYKKALAAKLYNTQSDIFNILKGLDDGEEKKELVEKVAFELGLNLSNKNITELKKALNRPIRVCGMVKNEGEPGGGPFWVKDSNNNKSLQIIESAQIDPNNSEQQEILKNSSHFNPVDLICATKDYQGNKFDLSNFVDPETGFISQKSKKGKDLKAMELPGLWNGAMANWLTLFIEVPVITFNPVKTINDLLRDTHQGI